MPEAGPATPVAVVAGRGELPKRVAEARRDAGMPYLLIVFPDCWEDWMADHPHERHEFEKAGRLFRSLGGQGVTHIVFAGGMHRPRLRPWRADWTALCLLGRALTLLRKGDDEMLRGFAAFFEARGLRMLGPHEVLGEDFMAPRGALGRVAPTAIDRQDAGRAARIVQTLGPLDVGQGAVVAAGVCLAIEAIEGTDLMLARLADLPSERRATAPPPCGVLYKGLKPGQDRRMDLPTIGPETVERIVAAGLNGIVVAADQTLVMDPDATRAAADRAGVFVFGATEDDLADWGARG